MKRQKGEEYEGFSAPGIRLLEEASPKMVAVHSSENELPLLYAFHMFDKAHLVMMAEQGMIPRQAAVSMLAALREMEEEGVEKVRLAAGNGKHSGEQYLIRQLGEEVGGRIHLARSSGDLGQVGLRIRLRDEELRLMDGLNEFRGALLETAGQHRDTVMPGYTHGQHAQPTTLGHCLVAYASALERDFERLEALFHRTNRSAAGAAVLTGSDFPVNRLRVAELLGFEKTIRNTNDAVLTQDASLEALSVLTILHNNVAECAADLQVWYSDEFGMIAIPDRFCGTSSILAQKKNPWLFESIKGAAAQTFGNLMTTYYAYKGPRGLAIAERRYVLTPLWVVLDDAARDLSSMAEVMRGLKVNKELMRERAGAFWAQASGLAGALVAEKGLPWRTAHQIVGILVRLSSERGIKPSDVSTAFLDEAALEYMGKPVGLSEDALRKALDPVEFIKARTLYGGTNPEEVRQQIAELAERLERDTCAVADLRAALKQASEKLESSIDAMLS
ncbi:MAG: argininosuccinate lyase [Chloroflexi bacterium]|nr:argininosuccinate lyase [Chloroflexota bacterium]